jgi:hypothetical protein
MLYFELVAEERIKKSQEKGDFDDLEGKGNPLKLEDDSFIPQELRMAYKALKNAGYLPPEAQIRKDISNALDLLEQMEDEKERYQQMQKLDYLIFKMKGMRSRGLSLDVEDEYYQSVVERLSVNRKKKE